MYFTGVLSQNGRWADCYKDDERIWRKGKPRPDYLQCYKDRINMVQNIRNTPGSIAYIKAYYASNPVSFILDWCLTYDPRNAGTNIPASMPFCLFERQIDMAQFVNECLLSKEKGLIEKSRDYGATWLCAALSVWCWLFMPGSSVGWGSRKQDLVDKLGDMDSIFEKIRFIVRSLPVELTPKGFREKDHATFMKLINPENGSSITGEAGDNIGRGGRKTIYFLDEAAHVERPELIEAALADNTDVRIDISSVNGVGNVFYRSRHAGVEWEPGKKIARRKTRVLILDWRDHPNKDQEWYNGRKKEAEEKGLAHIFAQEVDRDYSSSVVGVLIPARWVRAAVDAHVKLGIELTGTTYAGQDAADGGEDSSAMIIRKGIGIIHAAQDNQGADKVAPAMITQASMFGVEKYRYEANGVGTGVKVAAKMMEGVLGAMRVIPWLPNGKVVDPGGDIIAGTQPGDKDRKSNKDYFANLKAQASWDLRMRFERTYKWVVEGKECDPDAIISIPKNMPFFHQLEAELSQPTYSTNGAGKIIINKKPNGTKSPNLFDACVIAFSPENVERTDDMPGVGMVNASPAREYDSIF